MLDLAFAWLLSRPAVASVIAGATKPEQVAANVAAGGWSLSDEMLARVDAVAPAEDTEPNDEGPRTAEPGHRQAG